MWSERSWAQRRAIFALGDGEFDRGEVRRCKRRIAGPRKSRFTAGSLPVAAIRKGAGAGLAGMPPRD